MGLGVSCSQYKYKSEDEGFEFHCAKVFRFNRLLSSLFNHCCQVKEALINSGISEARMQTTGKGESVPITENNTPEGKANNRRVEFIKL
uniref:OmpA family protein n=1 Tax=Mariniflexile sp. TaxID=1979402 RepID=UPI0040470A93